MVENFVDRYLYLNTNAPAMSYVLPPPILHLYACLIFSRVVGVAIFSLNAAECMDLLEEMERQQKALSDENSALRRENESWSVEVTRLSAILAAREQVCFLV